MKRSIIIGASLLIAVLVCAWWYLISNYDIRKVSSIKEDVKLTMTPEMEKYLDCKNCITTYRVGRMLYVECKNYPALNEETNEGKWKEFEHHVSMLALIVGGSLKDTDMDTCRFVSDYTKGVMTVRRSLSITIKEYAEIYDKVKVAISYCRAISDSNFAEAKSYVSSEILNRSTEKEFDDFLNTFHSKGRVTDVKLQKYVHDLTATKNLLGVFLLVTYDNSKYEEVRIAFPYHGPKHIMNLETVQLKTTVGSDTSSLVN